MALICDVVKHLALSCTSTSSHDEAPGAALSSRRKKVRGSSFYSAVRPSAESMFTRTVDRVITLQAMGTTVRRMKSIESIFGVQLTTSVRRDYRVCVDFVLPGSEAEVLGLLPGAVVLTVNGRSLKGLNLNQVEGEIHHALEHLRRNDEATTITLEFSQRTEEMSVDRNPFEMTRFPSPQGQHLPGVKQFYETETTTDDRDQDRKQNISTPQHRERSRSMKHFWMSDRSAKSCYDCDQLFTFFRRRHHCRSCGQIFCSQCCARLPQSFGGAKDDESITRLRKQLVCHTCHRQLREGLEVELAATADGSSSGVVTKPESSPVSQTLLLMPPHVAEALERSTSDASTCRPLDKTEFFDKDEITTEARSSDVQGEKTRPSVLFSLFPRVQIVASVQQLHQPRLSGFVRKETNDSNARRSGLRRTRSEPLIVKEDIRQDELFRSFNRLKRSNSRGDIGNPSSQRWSEAEFKRLVEESNEEALVASSHGRLLPSRPKAFSGHTLGEARFGVCTQRNPFESITVAESTSAETQDSKQMAKEMGVLGMIGLAEDAQDETTDATAVMRKEDTLQRMADHARARVEERIFHLLDASPSFSRLPILEQHKWMQIIHLFAQRAAATISCQPDLGDSMDVMEYVQIKSVQGGRVQDSFFIDGVLVHKSLARKGMRSDIENPRILLIASALDYQRKKEAISSLESVAVQEVEYMHIVAEKIMTLHPDVVLFGGHVHRVAEELLFKENVAVIKNVRLVDLQRIARCTGASLLSSYDHVDKIAANAVIGRCTRFYVMISDQEPKSVRKLDLSQAIESNTSTLSRKKRPQRQNIVFEGGVSSKGCTICLRGGSTEVFEDVTAALSTITRAAYNMRLQRSLRTEFGFAPATDDDQHDRSVAEDWFAKSSSSLYLSLKSNSLSLRAALKQSQSMCKRCKENTRYNNISSLRVLGGSDDVMISRRASEVPAHQSSSAACSCSNANKSDSLRDRILFSACWSTLDGKTASKAEMMCIDFYSSTDCSLGQFFTKYCFSPSDREFRRAFTTSKLSFSHDTGRVTIRVKDLADKDQQAPAAELLRDIGHRALLRLVRSDKPMMWSRRLAHDEGDGAPVLSSRFAVVPDDVWNYSFGKFLEDLFYTKSMAIDTMRFPHLLSARGSRDPMVVHYFSRHGRIVSIQCEPVEPVLHVALQPALWQDRIDQQQQLCAVKELCDLVHEVYVVTTTKVAESLADMVTPLHAKQNLRILRNEVQQWYSCYASNIESNPPDDIFAKNALVRDIFQHAAGWSLRITQAMHSTVKLTFKSHTESSPKSALPRAWFDQLPAAFDEDSEIEFQDTVTEHAGSLENLAKFARSLASGELSTPSNFSEVTNEVTNTLNAKGSVESSDVLSGDERDDGSSRSYPAGPTDSWDSTSYLHNIGTASTIGSYSSRIALEAFRRAYQNKKPPMENYGYLTIPKRIIACHPSLAPGVDDTVVLVNATQPTSVVAYSLCSKEYTRQLNKSLREERGVTLDGPMNALQTEEPKRDAALLSILRSTKRNNVDHVFVDENQFQPATRFSCKSYYAMQFHALRRLYYGSDRNYVESLCHCEQWNAAGGKSGAGFLKTLDQRFIAKAIPQIELQMFLSMANEYFGYMAKTFENNLSSMLSKVLGIYKVTISSENDTTMCVIVMENLIYGRDVNFLFDLKGKMEGRYKETTDSATGAVLWDRNFVEMAGGIPLPLQESAMSLLLAAIVNDTAFLASVQATDYSMLVGYDVRKQELVACIIDYIHKYDFMKMVEHAGKRLIQDEGEITVLNPKHYRKRFCMAMTKYFTTIPSRYTRVTTIQNNQRGSTSEPITNSPPTSGKA